MNQTTLLKYNFRLLMLNNWLLLAFPIAVSQLTVFWLGITRKFTLDLPAACVEMVTPILAAFLGAHLLSAEYRSRVGAILASRPVNIGRIVFMRLVVMLALVWFLAIISLIAFRIFWGESYDMLTPLAASVPSTLFLTMLSLTYATLFRNALAGFAVAALYWSLDLLPGAPIQPYLSLHSLSSYLVVQHNYLLQTFLLNWWIAKLILLVGAVVLYFYHNRQVLSVGSPLTLGVRRRAAISAASILIVYALSGAVLKVAYGYTKLGELPHGDLTWFRYQMAPFGPVPVTALFGPSFRDYVGEIGNPWRMSEDPGALTGNTESHKREMHVVLDKNPGSVWAPGVAFELARMEAQGERNADAIVAIYRTAVNRYPNSLFCQDELYEIAKAYVDANRPVDAQKTYEELINRFPQSRHRSESFRYLFEGARDAKNLPVALEWAKKWSSVAPVQERFEALIDVAELSKSTGDIEGAKRAAADTIAAVAEFNRALKADELTLTPQQTTTRPQQARKAELEARSIK